MCTPLTLVNERVQVELFPPLERLSTHSAWERVTSVQQPEAEKKEQIKHNYSNEYMIIELIMHNLSTPTSINNHTVSYCKIHLYLEHNPL